VSGYGFGAEAVMREFKTRGEISAWLNQELHKHKGCEETRVTVQYQLREPDEYGCNWSRDLIINYGRDDNVLVNQHLRPLFEEARRRFNVREP
jgi:hypothetical protein